MLDVSDKTEMSREVCGGWKVRRFDNRRREMEERVEIIKSGESKLLLHAANFADTDVKGKKEKHETEES